ncbi:MAG: hypothetical protein RMI91_06535 [Gemmatales bacterium]|nr:hypothetical protein [Gemmatales bacterium]MDW7994293.1 hypothetical protein [Gemmatales bacterium]
MHQTSADFAGQPTYRKHLGTIVLRSLGCLLVASTLAPSPCAAQFQLILPILRHPTTPPELWNAVFFELEVGNFNRAEIWLRRLWETLEKSAPEERDKFLLDLHDREGLMPFFRLMDHPQLQKVTVKDEKTGQLIPIPRALLEQLNHALQRRIGDEKILQYFVDRLKGRPGERRFAMAQLVHAGERAVPYLIQALADPDKKNVHPDIVTTLQYMRGNAVAPLLTVLADAPTLTLRSTAFHILIQERDPRMIPYLWLTQANPNETPTLRDQARRALASLLHQPLPPTPSEKPEFLLGDWREELLRVAEAYYHRRAELPPGEPLTWWQWLAGKGLVAQTVSRREYEVLASTYWLRKILAIQPDYRPAQTLLINVLLERAVELAEWNKPLTATAPELVNMLSVTDPRILEEALDQALRNRKTASAFGILQVLNEIRNARLVQPTQGAISPLVRALSYPDPRVQWLATQVILQTPLPGPFPGNSRVVHLLARTINSRDTRRVVLALTDPVEARQVAERFRSLGYDPAPVRACRDVLREAAREPTDMFVLDLRLPDLPLDHVVSLLRQSPDTASVPIILWGPQDHYREALALQHRFRSISLAVPPPLSDAMFQHIVQTAIDRTSPPLTPDQRQAMRHTAFAWLMRIARGELPGFTIDAALPALTNALNDDQLAPHAAAVLTHVRSRTVQQTLAQALLAAQRPDPVMIALAQAFYDHVQANTFLLGEGHLRQLRELRKKPVPAPVRDLLTRLEQQLAPQAQATGQQLQHLPIPAPPRP